MKTDIHVHLLFLQGHHIEILLERRNNIIIYTDNNFHDPTRDNYLWNGSSLSLHSPDGKVMEMVLTDTTLIAELASQEANAHETHNYFCLTSEQLAANLTYADLNSYQSIFYSLNRWKDPRPAWEFDHAITYHDASLTSCRENRFAYLKDKSEDIFSFSISANPHEIVAEWQKYFQETRDAAFIFGLNCARASQWFLNKYAKIPAPEYFSAPFRMNQVMYFLHWPSIFPAFALIPKKIFDNAKFHVEARQRKDIALSYSQIYWDMAMSALLSFGSFTGLILSAKYLSRTRHNYAAPMLGWVSISSALSLFNGMNEVAAKAICDEHAKEIQNSMS